MNGFVERDEREAHAYLAEEIGGGISREQLLEAMEELLVFTKRAVYTWDDEFGALIFATVARSGRTFDGICKLLRAGLAVQAAMLCRALFEDMIVGHWLLYNHADHDWLVDKFLRQREAIALHKERVRNATGGSAIGAPLAVAEDVREREDELCAEFGTEAQKDWWDPGRKGRGQGRPVGIRKLVNILEDAAAERKMFHPRFAGGEKPLLRMFDRVTYKWLNQCIHHTTVGLPFTPTVKGEVEKSPDPMLIVSWHASWLFTQQVYLAHDATGMVPVRDLEATWWECMIRFSKAFNQTEWTFRLEDELMEILGVDLSRVSKRGWLYERWLDLTDWVGWWWFKLTRFVRGRNP
jgi:Family of unknown function (DUF5677)